MVFINARGNSLNIKERIIDYTKSHSLANFVGCVVGFLNVLIIRLWSLLLAVALSFECNSV